MVDDKASEFQLEISTHDNELPCYVGPSQGPFKEMVFKYRSEQED